MVREYALAGLRDQPERIICKQRRTAIARYTSAGSRCRHVSPPPKVVQGDRWSICAGEVVPEKALINLSDKLRLP